ncbi:MAG: hypothetical protein ACLQSR_11710, partial [Limisphaerales bacterium]
MNPKSISAKFASNFRISPVGSAGAALPTGFIVVCAMAFVAGVAATVYFCRSMAGGMDMPGGSARRFQPLRRWQHATPIVHGAGPDSVREVSRFGQGERLFTTETQRGFATSFQQLAFSRQLLNESGQHSDQRVSESISERISAGSGDSMVTVSRVTG